MLSVQTRPCRDLSFVHKIFIEDENSSLLQPFVLIFLIEWTENPVKADRGTSVFGRQLKNPLSRPEPLLHVRGDLG
jgi:hypothetical protein